MEYLNFREIASAARKKSGTPKPQTSTIANGLKWQGSRDSKVPTEFGKLKWKDRSSTTGNDSDWLSLRKDAADKWIDNLAKHYKEVYVISRKYRAEKKKKLDLFPEREAYLRKVGYVQMDREWWKERRADRKYTAAVARRRDVDNQILAKYARRKNDFPGRQVAKSKTRTAREKRIIAAMREYSGSLNRNGHPWLRPLRKLADMPDITVTERRNLWPLV